MSGAVRRSTRIKKKPAYLQDYEWENIREDQPEMEPKQPQTLDLRPDVDGQMRRLNAFLDDGSDSSYVRRSVLSELGISRIEDHTITMSTMTTTGTKVKSGTVTLSVESLNGNLRAKRILQM
ncbi:uncharacterized protein LOC135489221 [Lineus longissimus]|uniref:uncharacterized protein LOC135489221 n=1 Tax=Lineus longissimus TaxID=88925 RepID=UPI00315D0C10